MYKVLLKKQLLEINSWLILNKKSGKRRSAGKMAAMVIMWLVIFASLGSVFFGVGTMMCETFVMLDLGWMYIVMMAFMAIMLGVFGSVFNVNATMYQARDNEMLLSLPVKPSAILAARLAGVWLWSLIYEAIVFIPALIVYWMNMSGIGKLSAWIIIDDIFLMLVISVFILTLSCVLGWGVAKISTRLKGKSYVSVLLTIVFIALYYWVYFKANVLLQKVLENAVTIGVKIKGAAYPLYLLGRMGEGSLTGTVAVTVAVILLFALCCYVMSRSFISIATAKGTSGKKAYRHGASKKRNIGSALLFKERSRFTSSSTYMLNCGLGTLLLPAGGVFLIIKADSLLGIFPQDSPLLSLIMCAGVCMMASMNDITAPSVSLEGKSLWLIQSLPVSAWDVLKAKLNLHIAVTTLPVVFCSVCVIIAMHPTAAVTAYVIVLPLLFMLLVALFGLAVNLKTPNLKWTNETVPVKHSMGVFVSLMGGWVFVIALGGLYYLLRNLVSAEAFLGICGVIILALDAALYFWLKKTGTRLFEEL